ncbi:hypothetical protein N7454_008381 [Penicillium verhagenii]|nr:hypothetical protein N7454_008381 [Penicillium verhagenii]
MPSAFPTGNILLGAPMDEQWDLWDLPGSTPQSMPYGIGESILPAKPAVAKLEEATSARKDASEKAITHFTSYEAAKRVTRQTGKVVFDDTLPQGPLEEQQLVAELKIAMRSTRNAADGANALGRFSGSRWTEEEIELACWNLLAALLERHRAGASFTKAHMRRESGTFGDRFEAAVKALAESKTLCKHLLDPTYAETFMLDPDGARKRVVANKRVNDRKAGHMQKAMAVAAAWAIPSL